MLTDGGFAHAHGSISNVNIVFCQHPCPASGIKVYVNAGLATVVFNVVVRLPFSSSHDPVILPSPNGGNTTDSFTQYVLSNVTNPTFIRGSSVTITSAVSSGQILIPETVYV